MKHNYTELQLIKFIYQECDLFEQLEVEHALEEDTSFRFQYEELLMSYKDLPKVRFAPSQKSINNILRAASSPMAVC